MSYREENRATRWLLFWTVFILIVLSVVGGVLYSASRLTEAAVDVQVNTFENQAIRQSRGYLDAQVAEAQQWAAEYDQQMALHNASPNETVHLALANSDLAKLRLAIDNIGGVKNAPESLQSYYYLTPLFGGQ